MKGKRSSLKDIAAYLKVSVTTVSFVLNGKAAERHISKEMTKKVLEYADSINYKPNKIAQCLRTGKLKVLVFMVEDISDIESAKLAKMLEDVAYQSGYNLVFCSIGNEKARALELIDFYYLLQVDGFVIIPSLKIYGEIDRLFKEEGKPIVLLKEDLVRGAYDGSLLFKSAIDIIDSFLKFVGS